MSAEFKNMSYFDDLEIGQDDLHDLFPIINPDSHQDKNLSNHHVDQDDLFSLFNSPPLYSFNEDMFPQEDFSDFFPDFDLDEDLQFGNPSEQEVEVFVDDYFHLPPTNIYQEVAHPNTQINEEEAEEDFISQAWNLFQERFGQIQEAQAMYNNMHMMFCTGEDGHKISSDTGNSEAISSQAFLNVLNTVSEEELKELVQNKDTGSNETLKKLDEVAAATIDRISGTDTLGVINKMYDNGNRSFIPKNMANIMMEQHVHGIGCGHDRASLPIAGNIFSSVLHNGLDDILGHSHDHEKPTHICKECGKTHHLHDGDSGKCKCGNSKLHKLTPQELKALSKRH